MTVELMAIFLVAAFWNGSRKQRLKLENVKSSNSWERTKIFFSNLNRLQDIIFILMDKSSKNNKPFCLGESQCLWVAYLVGKERFTIWSKFYVYMCI